MQSLKCVLSLSFLLHWQDMFHFSSFYKNSLDWVGQKRRRRFPGAWRFVLGASLSVTGYRAALQSTCSLQTGTNNVCRGRDPAERDSPSTAVCANTAGLLWPSHTAPTLPILAEPAGQEWENQNSALRVQCQRQFCRSVGGCWQKSRPGLR